jgi:GNAT superfamily N-acetyltransferase
MSVALIRAAEVIDAAGISHVHVQSWLTTYRGLVPDAYLATLSKAERIPLWQDWLRRDISAFVAEVEGTIIGFVSGGPVREPLAGYDAELYTIYLLKEMQGRGVGTALLEKLAVAMLGKGHASMMVWVLEGNPAVRFYEKTGAGYLSSKQIEIGSVPFRELAFGWSDLRALTASGA